MTHPLNPVNLPKAWFVGAVIAVLGLSPGSAEASRGDGDLQRGPTNAPPSEPPRRGFLSTSLFMLVNLLPLDEPPEFFQLNYGHRFTPKDVLLIEAITWKYYAPLGIPYGSSQGDPAESFPGHVRDIGVGLAYQRFLWEGSYVALHATPFIQTYFDEAGDKIQTGFQLFTTLRFGYHFALGERLFLEPSVAFTAWPINTNLPASFQQQEDKWPSYFLFEPGLNFGVNL